MRRCGNAHSTEEDRSFQRAALTTYQAKLKDASSLLDNNSPIVIPVCFHVIALTKHYSFSDQQMQDQLDALNRAFSANSCCDESLSWCDKGMCSVDAGIRFAWAVVDENEDLVEGATIPSITEPGEAGACAFHYQPGPLTQKYFLRKGDASVLNVYWQDLGKVLGYASMPWQQAQLLARQDGVTIGYGTHSGSNSFFYNEGDTLVHEVGHWLGLLHTFDGGCEASDGIFDTAPVAEAFMGCDDGHAEKLDTCPGDSQVDGITNFMNYAEDRCMYKFTPGQVHMMRACYDKFRLRNKALRRETISLALGESSDGNYLGPGESQVFSLETSNFFVTCTITVDEVEPMLAMNWGTPPSFNKLLDTCTNDWFFFRSTSCTVNRSLWHKTLYATVRAPESRPVQNMRILCK